MEIRSFTTKNCMIYAVGLEKELQHFENYMDVNDNSSGFSCEQIIDMFRKNENIYAYTSAIKNEGELVSRQINDFLMRSNRMISEDAFLEAIAVSNPGKFSELTGMSEEEVEDVVKDSFWLELFKSK